MPPKWLPHNVHYEVQTGSVSYGVSSDDSDVDVVGFAIPPKEDIFPHLNGEIRGFGKQSTPFEQFQKHHVWHGEKEFDFTIYSIVKFFQLCMENNPNMVDVLFVPQRCVLHCSRIGQIVRDNRQSFLSKQCYTKFRGYAYSQLSKMDSKKFTSNEKRNDDVQNYGYSTKYAYHLVRLVLECQQILQEHDLDIQQNREILKSIRRGEWTISEVRSWFDSKEKDIETLNVNSTLREKPFEDVIRNILLQCLEEHYGSLDKIVQKNNSVSSLISEIEEVVSRHKG